MQNLILLMVVCFILGALVMTVTKRPRYLLWSKIRRKTKVLQEYWKIISILGAFFVLLYAVVLWLVGPSYLEAAISILNQFSGLTFAVYIGYFAFRQLLESRKDKLVEDADDLLRSQEYARAIQKYERIVEIDPEDIRPAANYIETCILDGDLAKAESLTPDFKKRCISAKEQLQAHYFSVVIELIKGHIPEAQEKIGITTQFIKQNRSVTPMAWGFGDLYASPKYQELTGDSRLLLDNFVDYLMSRLGDRTSRYEAGDYRLAPVPSLDKKN